MKKIISL